MTGSQRRNRKENAGRKETERDTTCSLPSADLREDAKEASGRKKKGSLGGATNTIKEEGRGRLSGCKLIDSSSKNKYNFRGSCKKPWVGRVYIPPGKGEKTRKRRWSSLLLEWP